MGKLRFRQMHLDFHIGADKGIGDKFDPEFYRPLRKPA